MAEGEPERPRNRRFSPSPTAPGDMSQTISPALALDLRLRFLETLLTGSSSPSLGSSRGRATTTPALSLTRRADLVQAQLKEALETGGGGDAVRRFVQGCACTTRPILLVSVLTTSHRRPQRAAPEACTGTHSSRRRHHPSGQGHPHSRERRRDPPARARAPGGRDTRAAWRGRCWLAGR